MPIRLLIADDHVVIRAGMRSLLANVRDIEIVGEATDGDEAIQMARRFRPDVMLLDVRMPALDGLGVLSQLRNEFPALAVVMFSSYDNPTYIARAVALVSELALEWDLDALDVNPLLCTPTGVLALDALVVAR